MKLNLPLFTSFLLLTSVLLAQPPEQSKLLRIGIIGLDTSHAPAFTKMLNSDQPAPGLEGCRVVAAYPKGSPDIESSVSRVPRFTKEVQEYGVEIVDSIEQLLERVDAVLLETNDGRPHLEQALPVLKARKPLFVDKPVAGSLRDAVAIYLAAERYDTPVFSSSSLRYATNAQKVRSGQLGKVLGCDAYSPAPVEPTHPDLFWYGIHGVELLYTVMGPGCQQVTRYHTPHSDLVVGQWPEGAIGTFRGLRNPLKVAGSYGGNAFTTEAIEPIGPSAGYGPLLVEIVQFFRTGEPPVSSQETLEIYAFMEAAEQSKRDGGKTVRIADVLQRAQDEAQKVIAR